MHLSAVCDFLTPPSPDQPITKRLSNSSASLHSPERGMCVAKQQYIIWLSLVCFSSLSVSLPYYDNAVCGVSPHLASPSPQRPAYKGSPSRKASNGPPEDKTPRTPTVSTIDVCTCIYITTLLFWAHVHFFFCVFRQREAPPPVWLTLQWDASNLRPLPPEAPPPEPIAKQWARPKGFLVFLFFILYYNIYLL